MRILYLGGNRGTSGHRAAALERLGHKVDLLDTDDFLPKGRFSKRFHYETGCLFCQNDATRGVLNAVSKIRGEKGYDVAWVNAGRNVGPGLINELRKFSSKVISYNNDDPYGNRDRLKWSLYLRSVPFYDLVVVVRPVNEPEAKARGAKDVLYVKMSSDEVAHRPRELSPSDIEKWSSDVIFAATWMPERGPLMAELISLNVPLSIYGPRWEKAREWPMIKPFWKGQYLGNEDDYCKAIQCSKVALGLVSKGNRDMHTQRSSEIPSLGALFCAERTGDHMEMYEEGVEAVFWSNAEECATWCRKLIADEGLRSSIAKRGQLELAKNGTLNEPTVARILERTFAKPGA